MDVGSIQSPGFLKQLFGTASPGGASLPGLATDLFGPPVELQINGAAALADPTGAILGAKFAGSVSDRALARKRQAQRQRDLIAAGAALLEKDFGRARDVAQQMLKRDSDDADATHIIGRSYQGEGDMRAAIKFFARAAQLAPDNKEYGGDLRNAQLLAGSDADAINAARTMLRDPSQRVAAIRLLTAVGERTHDASARLAIGDAYLEQKSRQLALQSYQAALDGADVGTLSRLAERAERLLADEPSASAVFKFRGDIRLRSGAFADAIDDYRTAQVLDTTGATFSDALAGAHAQRGRDFRSRGQLEEAQADLREAAALDYFNLDLKREMSQVSLDLGYQRMNFGALNLALGAFSDARVALPGDDPALQNSVAAGYFALGGRFTQAGDLETAAMVHQTAFDLNSTSEHRLGLAGARVALGGWFGGLNRWSDAVTEYEKAVELYPDNATYLALLEDARSRAGG